MAHEYRYKRTIQFAETDMAGIVHFTRYFRLVEEAEHAFLRSLRLSVHGELGGMAIGFPRIAARCEYLRPLRFEDEVETHIWVRRKTAKSITYHAEIIKGRKAAARIEMTVICCRFSSEREMEVTPIPPEYAEKIDESPHPPLEFVPREP